MIENRKAALATDCVGCGRPGLFKPAARQVEHDHGVCDLGPVVRTASVGRGWVTAGVAARVRRAFEGEVAA